MHEARVITWIGVLVAAAALCAARGASAARVPDPRRYVRDAAGRLVEIRHA